MSERPAVDSLGYEQARDELVEVVRALEVGGLGLDESVALWERGEALARRCDEQLAGARERIETKLSEAESSDS
ncbi:exodeoxyribonuclease VII small subunit [Pseudonocardia kongjuensis]|uniref:Exodeoxyribonuclease 7 small subunit n=1 Tax=Pseudonocardia kongjuensis TaxID=102227 RepID=A0ABP4IRG8_9PSEU